MSALLAGLAFAGGGFDKNHTDVRWNTLETEHFFIHWPESKRSKDHPHWFTTEFSAARLATIAEASYAPITNQFGMDLKEKTHVVLYDQDLGWEGNGFAIAELDFTGFPGMWGPLFRQRGRMDFLEDVFVHEFAHIVSLKAYLPLSEDSTGFEVGGLVEDEEWLKRWGAKGKASNVNADLGFAAIFSAHAPFWWAEGGAEYWSHKAGYNFWGTSREAYLRTSFLEDRVLSVDEWTTRMDKEGMDGERGYNQGYSFGLWLHDTHGGRDLMSEMARISGERWHWSWDRVVEKATGKSMQALYDAWYADRAAHYASQAAAVNARGRVDGQEMSLVRPAWDVGGPKWDKKTKKQRDEAMDGPTAYVELPSYSPDGRYVAWFDRGLNVREIRPEQWGAVGGEWVDEDDDEQLAAFSKRTAEAVWPQYWKAKWGPDRRLLVTGREDLAAPALEALGWTFDLDGKNWNQLVIGELHDKRNGQLAITWTKVPNTLRAEESAWSPDGRRIAFSRYDDGTTDLWMVDPDGENLERHSSFGDGTQIQGLSYSADGRYLVTALFKNFQQDLFLYDIEGRRWLRLTDSAADEVDPTWGADGRIWFGSDVDGISNIYSLDPDTLDVHKQTDGVGHAYGPDLAPGGHLFYTDTTGHGYRILGLHHDELKNERVAYPGLCGVDELACVDTEGFVGFKPALVDARAVSKRYNLLQAQLPLSVWPVLRTTDKNVELGGSLSLGDYAEEHVLEAQITAGKDNYLYVGYWNDMFWPHLNVGFARYTFKGTYGFGNDLDGVLETDDVTIVDIKFEQASDDAWAYASYSPSDYLFFGAGVDASRYSFRDSGDGGRFVPFLASVGFGGYVEWSPHDPFYTGDDWINPRGSRRVILDYQYRISNVLDPEIGGVVIDDGQRLDRYGYHRLMAQWTEFIPIGKRHTLQLDFEGGWIDRNVLGWDEFIAGGRHPYHWGNGTIGNNVQFSGYEGFSLYGETMLIANAAYRFPLLRDANLKIGPTYTDAVYLQFFGSAGNLWSYRVEGETHLEGYSVVPNDPSGVRREIPFKDFASKNSIPGKPNYLLSDVGAELRFRQFLWNDFDWDSFVRFAYGFRPTAGYGDVNADLIQSSVARDAASELSAEFEKPTFRIYLGLGTGW